MTAKHLTINSSEFYVNLKSLEQILYLWFLSYNNLRIFDFSSLIHDPVSINVKIMNVSCMYRL